MYRIHIQYGTHNTFIPTALYIKRWAKEALAKKIKSAEITIRIVDEKEMAQLNSTYRHKKGPTNVLSFPFSMPKNINIKVPLLGDIAICAHIVNREAKEQVKTKEAHWAHMIVHGIFHLLGFDHKTESEATLMESLEIKTMQALGFENPYE